MVYANSKGSYPNSRSLRALGGLVRALDFLHPALASALVNRVFFMPFSKTPTVADRRALSKAERLSLPFRRGQLGEGSHCTAAPWLGRKRWFNAPSD